MKTYKAMYRCRLCGKSLHSPAEATHDKAMNNLYDLVVTGRPQTGDPKAPRLLEVHNCGAPYEGSLGLADFIGWHADSEGCKYNHHGRCWGQPETPPCSGPKDCPCAKD